MDRSFEIPAEAGRPSSSRASGAGGARRQQSSSGVFDYEDSLARLGGDRQLFDDIVAIFLEDAPLVFEQASGSLAAGDSATLERAAHTLKGLSANFAAASAVAAAYAVELHARERQLDNAAVCFPQLESELHRLQAALRNFRQQCRDA
jgi:two-component system, sensor histidine kinase and response regulator